MIAKVFHFLKARFYEFASCIQAASDQGINLLGLMLVVSAQTVEHCVVDCISLQQQSCYISLCSCWVSVPPTILMFSQLTIFCGKVNSIEMVAKLMVCGGR